MAIFGVGAYYEEDVSQAFIQANLVGVGWDATDAPELHQFMRSLKVGDIVQEKIGTGTINTQLPGQYSDDRQEHKRGRFYLLTGMPGFGSDKLCRDQQEQHRKTLFIMS